MYYKWTYSTDKNKCTANVVNVLRITLKYEK